MSTLADEELHRFASLWWSLMLFGVAVLGVGIFFVASPHETLGTFTVIAGAGSCAGRSRRRRRA